MEVTRLAKSGAMEMERLAAGKDGHRSIDRVPGLKLAWDCRFRAATPMTRLRRFAPDVARICEVAGVTRPEDLWQVNHEAALYWYRRSPVSMSGHETANNAGRIFVLPDGVGSVVDDELRGLPDWVTGLIDEPVMVEDVAKLASSKFADLHLYLAVHQDEFPPPLLAGLTGVMSLPSEPPLLRPPLTHLWIAPRWGNVLILWSHETGWMQFQQVPK